MLLHTEAFTHRSFCSENPLHRAALTHSNFYTRKPLHRADSTQKSFLHREAFTHTSHLPLSAEPSAQFSQLQSAQTTLTAAPWQAPCCGTLQRHQHARFKTHIYPTYPLLEVRTPIASLSGEKSFLGVNFEPADLHFLLWPIPECGFIMLYPHLLRNFTSWSCQRRGQRTVPCNSSCPITSCK